MSWLYQIHAHMLVNKMPYKTRSNDFWLNVIYTQIDISISFQYLNKLMDWRLDCACWACPNSKYLILGAFHPFHQLMINWYINFLYIHCSELAINSYLIGSLCTRGFWWLHSSQGDCELRLVNVLDTDVLFYLVVILNFTLHLGILHMLQMFGYKMTRNKYKFITEIYDVCYESFVIFIFSFFTAVLHW